MPPPPEKAERSDTEQTEARIYFLECMDRINRVIHNADDPEHMLWQVLQTAYSLFDCDRIWLLYPCDPQAETYRIPVEVTRPQFPGAHQLNHDIPMKPGGDQVCAQALASPGAVTHFVDSGSPVVFKELHQQFGVRSQMVMALAPRTGRPWMLGMHQCSYDRNWTTEEKRLFEGIAQRIGEGLSTLLLLGELRESQERFDLAVRGARDGLWDWQETSSPVMWWSPRVFEMLGFAADEIPSTADLFNERVHSDDRQRVQRALQHHLQGWDKPFDLEYRIRSKSGDYLWLHARGESIRSNTGETRRMSGSIQDISQRRLAEEELRKHRDHLEELVAQRTETLQGINADLEATNAELEAFAYTVSHDLRNPLTSILGFAEVLRDDASDSQSLEMLNEIIAQGEKMVCLMEDLLTIARVGHIRRPADTISSEKACREVLSVLQEEFSDIADQVHLPPSLPSLQVPYSHLYQIFANLIGNALRYAGVAGAPVEVTGERLGNRVRFSIRDHGPGIPAEEQPSIFEAFYRGETAGKTQGSGVGLAIVAKIAKHYGGRAWLENTPGGGCTFLVEVVDGLDVGSAQGSA